MLKQSLAVMVVVLAWGAGSVGVAAAQHERAYEFDETSIAISIERFMGVDYTDFEGPGGGDLSARLLLNAAEPVPTSYARFGFDVFIERLSIGLGAGVAQGISGDAVAIVAPRVGYLLGLTPTLGLWLRGGVFYTNEGPNYLGVYAEALLSWFPYRRLAFTFGPTLDVAFADDPGPDYVSIGLPEVGMTVWF